MNVLNDLEINGNLDYEKSYIGEIIFSKTLSTMEQVIAIYGGTKWVSIQSRFLLGTSSAYPINTTGGEATHTLTVSELPSHSHGQKVTANDGTIGIRHDYSGEGKSIIFEQGINTESAGGNQPHNNMPPYVTVYMWERTA